MAGSHNIFMISMEAPGMGIEGSGRGRRHYMMPQPFQSILNIPCNRFAGRNVCSSVAYAQTRNL